MRSPEFATDSLQIVKAALAATTAWWVSVHVLESSVPFLAPWTALLTVHATVYRSFARGVQMILASALGVGLSFLIGSFLGVSIWTFSLALVVGLIGSRIPGLREEGVAIATTAIFVLGSGFGDEAPSLDNRLLEVGLGVGVGMLFNALLMPPLRDRQAARHVDRINQRMGGLMMDMANQLVDAWNTERADGWIQSTMAIDDDLRAAGQSVRFARESARWNPRRHIFIHAGSRGWRSPQFAAGERVGYEEILGRLSEGISHLRHLARTLREAPYSRSDWDDQFRENWVDILRNAGQCIKNPDAEVEPIYERLDRLSRRFSDEDELPSELWPTYGSLLTSVRHITVIVDDVASARRARTESKSNPVA